MGDGRRVGDETLYTDALHSLVAGHFGTGKNCSSNGRHGTHNAPGKLLTQAVLYQAAYILC